MINLIVMTPKPPERGQVPQSNTNELLKVNHLAMSGASSPPLRGIQGVNKISTSSPIPSQKGDLGGQNERVNQTENESLKLLT